MLNLFSIRGRNGPYGSVSFCGNSKGVVDQITTGNDQRGSLAIVLEDIADLRHNFESCNFFFINRLGNQSSHLLAKFAVKLERNVEWENHFPVWLTDIANKKFRVVAPFCT